MLSQSAVSLIASKERCVLVEMFLERSTALERDGLSVPLREVDIKRHFRLADEL